MEENRVPSVEIRFAAESDLFAVNLLRKEVNDLHVAGKPEIFKPGFSAPLRDYLYEVCHDPEKRVLVADCDGVVAGYAILHAVHRPETPYMFSRHYLDVDEFCVSQNVRRQGIGAALVRFIRDYAKAEGFPRVELNMWEFNQDALAFYEAVGFSTYRRYLELKL